MNRFSVLIFFSLLIFTFTFSFMGCKGEDEEVNSDKDVKTFNQNERTFKFKNRLFSIPSPFHATKLIKSVSAEYNEDCLNNPKNRQQYHSTDKMALNLGIYTTDLVYTNIYEQFSSTTNYIKVVRSLSSDLQIINTYSGDLLIDIEKNIKNSDSLNIIFTKAYRETDMYLTDNERENTAILVIVGSWIEGLHLLNKITNKTNNKILINRIGEQKYSLNNLIVLLTQTNSKENSISNEVLNKLNDLKKTFKKFDISYKYDKQIVLPDEKKTIIISETKITITPKILEQIYNKTEVVRNLIIK